MEKKNKQKKLVVKKKVVTQQTEELDEDQLLEVTGGYYRCSFELTLIGGFTTRFTNA
ncbi:MAG: hypothetical protein AAF799_13500 [Myxococcota bacterium]